MVARDGLPHNCANAFSDGCINAGIIDNEAVLTAVRMCETDPAMALAEAVLGDSAGELPHAVIWRLLVSAGAAFRPQQTLLRDGVRARLRQGANR